MIISDEGLILLKDALVDIRNNPKLHNQGVWYRKDWCGTTCCLFGNIALRAGATVIRYESGMIKRPDGLVLHVFDYVRHLLGIDIWVADILSNGGNSIDDLERMYGQLENDEEPTRDDR